jgi:hypothetical protein
MLLHLQLVHLLLQLVVGIVFTNGLEAGVSLSNDMLYKIKQK